MIKRWLLNQVNKRIIKELGYNNENIMNVHGSHVKHDITLGNLKCFCNSYDNYIKNKDMKFVACVCLDIEYTPNIFIHFLNYSEKEDTFFDDTLGGQSMYYYYYIFTDTLWIYENIYKQKQNFNPTEIFREVRENFYNEYVTNWFVRLFVKQTDY